MIIFIIKARVQSESWMQDPEKEFDLKLEVPVEAIGLQCAQLTACNLDFEGPPSRAHKSNPPNWQTFSAGSPWWRDDGNPEI